MIKNAKKPAGMLAGDFMQTAKQLAQLHAIAPAKFKHKAESMGLSARKAYYLLEVHQAFRLTKAPKDRLLGIGWTKAQLLSKVVTGDNWLYWLEQAEALAVHELKDLVKGIQPELNKHCVQFYLSAEQFELLAVVLAQFGAVHEHRHIHGKEKALMAALSTLAEHGANGTQQPLS